MTWSTPLTAVSNTALTAAQWNASVRDNLLETAPAKASAAGQLFASTGSGAIAARTPTNQTIAATETSTSLTYVDLATLGPTVSVVTGAAALVFLTCSSFNSAANASWMAYDVSGATTIAATDNTSVQFNSSGGQRFGVPVMQTGLTPGTNVFTAKYRNSTSGTGTWSQRRLAVLPL